MQNAEVINRAIAAHAEWKHRLNEAIETGRSQWTPDGVRSDVDCDFGQWLMSLSPSEKASEHYTKVLELHREFHEVVAGVLELALSGRKEEAKESVALRSRFGMLSSHLTLAMSAWKKSSE